MNVMKMILMSSKDPTGPELRVPTVWDAPMTPWAN